jgi:uncharacterized protein DUF2510
LTAPGNTLYGATYAVTRKFYADVAAADAALAEMMCQRQYDDVTLLAHQGAKMRTLPAPGWCPDPMGASEARYWNGRRWTLRCEGSRI